MRGNPVMKAKRVTGPSANTLLSIRHTRDLARERARLASMKGISPRKVTVGFAPDPLERRSVFGN